MEEAKFKIGDHVLITNTLNDTRWRFPWKYGISDQMLQYSGKESTIASVKRSEITDDYFYTLSDVISSIGAYWFWHEDLLEFINDKFYNIDEIEIVNLFQSPKTRNE